MTFSVARISAADPDSGTDSGTAAEAEPPDLTRTSESPRQASPPTPVDAPASDAVDDRRILGTGSRRAMFFESLSGSWADSALPFLPVYLVVLGASTAQVGLLAAGTALAGLVALLPAAWLARRTGSRVRLLMAGNWAMRGAILLFAVTPFLLGPEAAIVALIVLGGLRALIASLNHPSWMSLYADVIPSRLAGKFNARRSLLASIVAMSMVPALGWAIGRVGGVQGYQVAFAVTAAIGILGTLLYTRVAEPPRAAAHSRRHAYGKVLRDVKYRRFLLAQMMLHGFATLAGPFVVVHMVRNLGASTGEVGLVATGDAVAAVLGQLLMGFLVARYSSRGLFLAAIIGIALSPVAWLSINSPWQAALPVFLGGMSWAVCHLAVFNLLLEHAPSEDIPEYVAAQQIAMLSAGFVGPLLGSALVAAWGIPAVFALSAVGRLLAIPLFVAPVPRWVFRAWRRSREFAAVPLSTWR